MRRTLLIATAEIREGMRNRWILGATSVLTLFAMSLAVLGTAPIGEIKAGAPAVITVSLASLSVYVVPLLALMLSFDAIGAEAERGTLLLLLTYPLTRRQVLLGKFLGHFVILAQAVLTGFGAAALYIVFSTETVIGDWTVYGAMLGSTLLLGAVFLSLGYLLSVIVRSPATALNAALGLWLALAVFYDFLILGLILAEDGDLIGGKLIGALLHANPVDVYRIFNLGGSGAAAFVSGMAGVSGFDATSPALLLGIMAAWVAVPLWAAIVLFERREV